LTAIVQDARRLLGWARSGAGGPSEQAETIAAAAALLQRLIAQDVEEKPEGGCQIKPGTAKDRMVSVPDPEMRHGRKSASKRFNGHKAAVAVDLESQLIAGVEVLAGNAGDQEKALDLVRQSERVMEAEVVETVGRLCLRGRADAARLCRRRAGADGQGAGHQQRRSFSQEGVCDRFREDGSALPGRADDERLSVRGRRSGRTLRVCGGHV